MSGKAEMQSGLITRSEEPLNLEMPFASLRDFVTPNESFYIRSHFPIPQIEKANWRLKIVGAVKTPVELGFDDLTRFETRTLTAVMECAGNGRSHLVPKVKGVAWDIGAVGNAEWRGVWLRDVLARAGVKENAAEV
ncbi:MAG: molybdopterin-dependent oxidoreductase, partial [Chthoniobacterales bacterium]